MIYCCKTAEFRSAMQGAMSARHLVGGAARVRYHGACHIGNTVQNANATSIDSITCHPHSFRVTECENSKIFYFNGSGSNTFRTRSEGSEFSRTLNGTVGPVLVSNPNPNPNLAFGPVRSGFGPWFRTEPSHHYVCSNGALLVSPKLHQALPCPVFHDVSIMPTVPTSWSSSSVRGDSASSR